MEAKDYTWLRSQLRRISRRWPPIYEALANAKQPYIGDNKRKKWMYKCAECGNTFDNKDVMVDHINPCGALKEKSDIATFVLKLFCEADELQVLCKECHDVKSYAERYRMTLEEASLEKTVIAFGKLSAAAQIKMLKDLKLTSAPTKEKRLIVYREYLKGEVNV